MDHWDLLDNRDLVDLLVTGVQMVELAPVDLKDRLVQWAHKVSQGQVVSLVVQVL